MKWQLTIWGQGNHVIAEMDFPKRAWARAELSDMIDAFTSQDDYLLLSSDKAFLIRYDEFHRAAIYKVAYVEDAS